MFTIDESRHLLTAARLFFDPEDDVGEQMLNLNDAFYWGSADAEHVDDSELQRVADLFWRFGHAGVLYWVVTKRNIATVEFADVNRQIDFVRHEEAIRASEPSDSKRAYLKKQYTIG